MEELHKLVFGTIVCDGCGCRIDSHCNDERIYDLAELLECELDYRGWIEISEDKWYCPDCADNPSHRTHPGEGRVIAERDTLSGLRCDHCGRTFEDIDGFSMWVDFSLTKENARDGDWRQMGDKMLCPDCYGDCDVVKYEGNAQLEEKYCSKCPYEGDCNEEVELETPKASEECECAIRGHEDVRYSRCPFYQSHIVFPKCTIPAGEKCPRLVTWEMERKEVAKLNNEILEWSLNIKKKNNG